MILRDYQIDAIDRLSRSVKEHRRSVLVAPTGAGKTVIASEIIRRCVAKGYRILFLAHRRELIEQCSGKLTQLQIEHGIIKAGMESKLLPHLPVQVASVQTLHSRIRTVGRWTPKATLIICDEAHRIMGETWIKVLDHYADAMVIGLTATPYRTDGKGLGNVFCDLVVAAHVDELIDQGHLINPRLIVGQTANLDGIKKQAGDYKPDDLAKAMNTDYLVGDVIDTWQKFADGTPTVLFACSVEHSKHFVERFKALGVAVDHVDGLMPEQERAAILKRFRNGDITVLCNCNILTEGFDLPSLVTCIIARPTMSAGLYRQMIGRVMRPADGKREAIVIDHAGCIWEHGKPDDRVEFSLDDSRKRKKKEAFICMVCLEDYTANDIIEDDRGLRFAPCGHIHGSTVTEAIEAKIRDRIKAEIDGIMVDVSAVTRAIDQLGCAKCGSSSVKKWKSMRQKIRYIHLHCLRCGSFSTVEEQELWNLSMPSQNHFSSQSALPR